ncbi:MAG: O-methyltransferase [Chloroflexi bacterium]|nr:O-methyltransferase [Chloroflexota bacterium]
MSDLEQQAKEREEIRQAITDLFASEDEGLRYALEEAQAAGMPDIQISPIHGKLLQLLAAACNAHKILEIGALAGYSGIWLARALPEGGHLITIEANPMHAEVAERSFAKAGVQDRAEVKVGRALDILPGLLEDGPFDLIFIDADRPSCLNYLEWALRLSRPGSIIIADNCLPRGSKLRFPEPGSEEAVEEYNRRLASNPSVVALSLPLNKTYTDGFAIAVVRSQATETDPRL